MPWTLTRLHAALAQNTQWVTHLEHDCLTLTNEDGLDAYLAISGQQIVIEAILFAKSQVKNPAELNEHILKTHKLYPLTSVAITHLQQADYYCAFGAISAATDEASLQLEVETLFNNVSGFLEAYHDYLY